MYHSALMHFIALYNTYADTHSLSLSLSRSHSLVSVLSVVSHSLHLHGDLRELCCQTGVSRLSLSRRVGICIVALYV